MKFPKKVKRHCPKCKTHTEHKLDLVSTGHKRGALKRGSLTRMKKRGASPGTGNKGRASKPAIKSWKRKTKTTTRKVICYKCTVCKRAHLSRSRRVSKLILENPVK
jgi:large subunit ribosomal protein L44e